MTNDFTLLPQAVQDTDLLSLGAKKLAERFIAWKLQSNAVDQDIMWVSQDQLCKGCIRKGNFNAHLNELEVFDLVHRVTVGTGLKDASTYIVNIEKFEQELKRLSLVELSKIKKEIKDKLNSTDTPETPMGTTILYNTILSNTIQNKTILENTIQDNIIQNDIIQDNITVIEDDPKQGESVKEDVSKDIKPAYADTAYAKTLEDFFNDLKIASTVSEVNRAFVGASRLIKETDINGRLTLLQAVADTIKRNNVDFSALDGEEPDEKVVRLEDLFSTPTGPTELLKRIDRIKPLSIQLTVGLRRLSKRLIPRETSISWWKEGLRK